MTPTFTSFKTLFAGCHVKYVLLFLRIILFCGDIDLKMSTCLSVFAFFQIFVLKKIFIGFSWVTRAGGDTPSVSF